MVSTGAGAEPETWSRPCRQANPARRQSPGCGPRRSSRPQRSPCRCAPRYQCNQRSRNGQDFTLSQAVQVLDAEHQIRYSCLLQINVTGVGDIEPIVNDRILEGFAILYDSAPSVLDLQDLLFEPKARGPRPSCSLARRLGNTRGLRSRIVQHFPGLDILSGDLVGERADAHCSVARLQRHPLTGHWWPSMPRSSSVRTLELSVALPVFVISRRWTMVSPSTPPFSTEPSPVPEVS